MKISDLLDESAGVGKIVNGVNTTIDVKPGETKRQAAKFGNVTDLNGRPKIAATNGSDAVHESEPWKTKNPKKHHKKLTPAQKSAAKTRAKNAGRPYPNLIDNMWASKH